MNKSLVNVVTELALEPNQVTQLGAEFYENTDSTGIVVCTDIRTDDNGTVAGAGVIEGSFDNIRWYQITSADFAANNNSCQAYENLYYNYYRFSWNDSGSTSPILTLDVVFLEPK